MFYTHINRGIINSNRKNGTNFPPVRFQRGKYGKPTYAFSVEIPGPSRITYSPLQPILPCGARMVIESEDEPIVPEPQEPERLLGSRH